jgi:hypothetical protein
MLLSPLAYSADTPNGAVSEFTANEELILYTVAGGSAAITTGLLIDVVSYLHLTGGNKGVNSPAS